MSEENRRLQAVGGGFYLGVSEDAFSADELDRLRQFGWFFSALAKGARKPTTPAQIHFQRVCWGLEKASTDDEKLWRKRIDLLPKR